MRRTYLGEFEEIVPPLVAALNKEAYGACQPQPRHRMSNVRQYVECGVASLATDRPAGGYCRCGIGAAGMGYDERVAQHFCHAHRLFVVGGGGIRYVGPPDGLHPKHPRRRGQPRR